MFLSPPQHSKDPDNRTVGCGCDDVWYGREPRLLFRIRIQTDHDVRLHQTQSREAPPHMHDLNGALKRNTSFWYFRHLHRWSMSLLCKASRAESLWCLTERQGPFRTLKRT